VLGTRCVWWWRAVHVHSRANADGLGYSNSHDDDHAESEPEPDTAAIRDANTEGDLISVTDQYADRYPDAEGL